MKTKIALLVLLLAATAPAFARVTITPEWCGQVRQVSETVMIGRLAGYQPGKVYADTSHDCSMGNQVELCVVYNDMVLSAVNAAFSGPEEEWQTADEARGIARKFGQQRYSVCMGHLWESAQ